MDIQETFERVESKYLLDRQTYQLLMDRIRNQLTEDLYPHSEISSIYFDTSDYRLIRNTLDRPVYREKLRLRSYGTVDHSSTVFMEIKKKYGNKTYKRRQEMSYDAAMKYLLYDRLPLNSQIMREIDYLRNHDRQLNPKVLIAYSRDSWAGLYDPDLRITFDTNVRFDTDNLLLTGEHRMTSLLDDDKVIMEIKTNNSMPLWLTHSLTELRIYPSSFSKYGQIYTRYIMKGDTPCYRTYSTHSSQTHLALRTTLSAQQYR